MSSKIEFMKKVSKIQKELKAPKTKWNKFSEYYYRNCEDILDAVKDHLDGLVLTINDELVLIGDRYYVKATATITDGENSLSNTAFARETLNAKGKDESQITGSTSSYSRKYALNGLFLIDDSLDADAQNNAKTEEPKANNQTPVKNIPKKEEQKNTARIQLFIPYEDAQLRELCKSVGFRFDKPTTKWFKIIDEEDAKNVVVNEEGVLSYHGIEVEVAK